MPELSQIPDGRKWTRLEDLGEVFAGTSAPQDPVYFENGKWPFVRVQDLGRHGRTRNLSETKDKLNEKAIDDCYLKFAKRGTILLPKSGAAILTNSRAVLGMDAYIVSHLAGITPNESLAMSEWIYSWLCLVDMKQYVDNPAYPSLRLSKLKKIWVPVAPFPEQQRIVAKIDTMFDRTHEAKRLRVAAHQETKSVFDAALEEVLDEVYSRSPEIPPLSEFATAFNGKASGSGQSNVRVFKTKHVYPFNLKQTSPSFMRPDQASKCPRDRYLRSGDVLLCNIARGTLGRLSFIESAEGNWTVDTQIMILRSNNRCLGKWLFYYSIFA